jgi:glycosyltransferase involved in cell wall biosynthesis
MIKVHISPNYVGVPAQADNGGIRRVIEAEIKHLPEFDVEVVGSPKEADVIQNHGGMLTYAPGVPVVHCGHGLYWSRQPWQDNFQEVNAQVVESMARAVAHTAPSEWVSRAIRRGGFFYPLVVYHGVDASDFTPSPDGHDNYVLWNKMRQDYVSDPKDMQTIATRLRNTRFLTTVGQAAENVKVIGAIPYQKMKRVVARAGVYLATARETFGIGTLEAMASGVPVAGWSWGGTEEIIQNGITGYLATPGDWGGLSDAIARCFAERDRLSANARADVEARWGWEPRIKQYADLFKRVHKKYSTPGPAVSVIVTTYHLDKYLPQCLDSVLRQTLEDWECLVIDDANDLNTRRIVENYANIDRRISYLPTPNNFGLPGARNFGFSNARGRYIRHLDADDWLDENALGIEAGTLSSQPGMHIVYGHMETVNEDGSRNLNKSGEPIRSGWPTNQFDWVQQMAHMNQIPSCAMARREVFERSGGYRERMKRNEDAEFWCRTTSMGFRARKVTQAVTYFHRMREDSKGALEWKTEGREPDWTAWFPWRVGAGDLKEARDVLKRNSGEHPSPHIVPFGAQGQAPGRKFWYIHDYAYPVVSVIITVGPGHKRYLLDALDSIQAQSYPDWECLVVNDTGKAWPPDIMGAPWAKVINMDSNQGAAAARNAGYPHTRGRYVIWMDADDIWMPWYLDVMVAHAERNDGIVFSDCLLDKGEKDLTVHHFEDFRVDALAANMRYAGTSVLIPRHIVQAIFDKQGGWDTQIPGKEDHDWQIAVHSQGFCAYRVPEPLFVYRMYSSTKRESDFRKIDIIGEYLNQKWHDYRIGGKQFMCNCGGLKPTKNSPASLLSSSGNFNFSQDSLEGETSTQMVQVEYIGPRAETFSIRSRVLPGKTYRFGNNPHHKEQTVFLGDAEYLLSLLSGEHPQWRVLTSGANLERRDPAAVLGVAIGV